MIASLRAYLLADAILQMARRMAASETNAAYAFSRHFNWNKPEDLAEQKRHLRDARRQYKALYRLTAALRDLDGTR